MMRIWLCLGLLLTPAQAETILDVWDQIKAPPPPTLQSVEVSAKTDALLLLDFNGHEAAGSGPCNRAQKPRCLASIPKVKAALEAARAHGVLVVYSLTPNATPQDIWPDLAPLAGEPVVKSGPNKFLNTDLRAILAAKGIARVIVTGTASEGAVLNTAADAAFHGLNVVAPLDGISSADLYAEQYVAWHLTHAPGVAGKSVLTALDRLKF